MNKLTNQLDLLGGGNNGDNDNNNNYDNNIIIITNDYTRNDNSDINNARDYNNHNDNHGTYLEYLNLQNCLYILTFSITPVSLYVEFHLLFIPAERK